MSATRERTAAAVLLTATEDTLPWALSVPPAARGGDAPRPLLCFLHGRDEAAPLPLVEGVTRHGPLSAGSWERVRATFLVVAPQLRVGGDRWGEHADEVAALVARLQREHGGDPARTYLTGFSFGGNGVLDVARLRPQPWAALWAVDPTRVPAAPLAQPLWLSVGERARPQLARFIAALDLRAAEATAAGDRLWLDEGRDHVTSAARAYADARIYRWLLDRAP